MTDRAVGHDGVVATGRRAAFRGAILALLPWIPGALAAQEGAWPGAPRPGAEAPEAVERRVLTLEDAVEMALNQSRDVRDARLALRLAEEQVSEAWSGVYPAVDLNASYTRNVSPNVSFLPAQIFDPSAAEDDFVAVQFGADNAWNSALTLEQPLFRAGVFIGVGAAGRFRTLQEETLRGRTQAVVTRVRTAYYDLLLSREEARLTENSVARVRQSLDEARALNRAGLTSDYDVLRLEVELANLEPNLRRARNAESRARRALALELALDDAETLDVAGSLATLDLEDVDANTPENRTLLAAGAGVRAGDEAEGLFGSAVERRSDLRQLELTEDLRRAELRLEQSEYLPSVSVFGNYIINAQQNGSPAFFGQSSAQRAYLRQVGVSVSVPVFTGFRRNARIDQKRAALRQAEIQTQLGRDRARNQIRDLVDAVEEARERAAGQRLAVRQAERGFEIASVQYREGVGSQLERTDAEVALRQSEFNYAQAAYDYLVARTRLDEAVGLVPGADGAFAVGR